MIKNFFVKIKNKTENIFWQQFEKEGYKILKNGWPDFLIMKDRKVSFVEVKEDNDKLKNTQIKLLEMLEVAGLSCFIWNPKKGLMTVKNYMLIPTKKKINKSSIKKGNAKKLHTLGIETPEQLMQITKRRKTLCRGILKNRIPVSKKVALKIREATGASLDFLLS